VRGRWVQYSIKEGGEITIIETADVKPLPRGVCFAIRRGADGEMYFTISAEAFERMVSAKEEDDDDE
jgi:hypothetical protein